VTEQETAEELKERLHREFVDSMVVMIAAYASGFILFLEWISG
jgi:hypothetical protein